MEDEVMSSLRRIKEDIAREHDYDLELINAMVQRRERAQAHRVVDRVPAKKRGYLCDREGREAS